MKTPGVYIVEKNAASNSVVEVATAVPAFIGYTEKALNGNISLLNKPWRICSMTEFKTYFGDTPKPEFSISEDIVTESGVRFQGKSYVAERRDKYSLYYNLLLFYANGGGPCYIVSVGSYADDVEKAKLEAGLMSLVQEQEPTIVVIPEAVKLSAEDCYALQRAMLSHCGDVMRNRFAILDIYDGYKALNCNMIRDFCNAIGEAFLDCGAAYYPWLRTDIVQERDLNYTNISAGDIEMIKGVLLTELAATNMQEDIKKLGTSLTVAETEKLHKMLTQISSFYRELMKEIHRVLNLLPVSAAMAGIYTKVDNTRGVWKAPANVDVANAVSPAVDISHTEQEDLNVPMDGKSVNAIRVFPGEGIKVWGARTLDGNSLDWRYINVRRTMIFLEQSIKNTVRAYVFEPNDANTWITLRLQLENFLRGVWKRGGLAGATPEDAYAVQVGLGETMTPNDILDGIMRVKVLVAVTHPAEFLEISFEQQMQKNV